MTPSTPASNKNDGSVGAPQTIVPDLARLRQEYAATGLTESDLAPNWHIQFGRWLADALAAELPEPNAMVFATADAQGRPSARTVLLKEYDERGFTLFTNLRSRKGVEAQTNPYASLVFAWQQMGRQVVVTGRVEQVDRAETEAYFALRPRGAQLGAWASAQSSVVAGREVLDAAWRELAERYPEGTPVPAPPHWGGLRVVPESVEFWQGRPSRLHDRLRYRLSAEGWVVERLAP